MRFPRLFALQPTRAMHAHPDISSCTGALEAELAATLLPSTVDFPSFLAKIVEDALRGEPVSVTGDAIDIATDNLGNFRSILDGRCSVLPAAARDAADALSMRQSFAQLTASTPSVAASLLGARALSTPSTD